MNIYFQIKKIFSNLFKFLVHVIILFSITSVGISRIINQYLKKYKQFVDLVLVLDLKPRMWKIVLGVWMVNISKCQWGQFYLWRKLEYLGNITVPGENQKTWKKTDYQGKSQYQEKITAPEKTQRARWISQYQVKTTVPGKTHSTRRKPDI